MMALRRIWLAQPPRRRRADGPPAFMREANANLQAMLTRVFEPHRDELSVDPSTAATVLRTLVLGSRHPGADPDTRLSAEQIVDVLLDGIRTRTEKGD
jgi:hypothetical protein